MWSLFAWPLYYMSFFDLQLVITTLVSSTFPVYLKPNTLNLLFIKIIPTYFLLLYLYTFVFKSEIKNTSHNLNIPITQNSN
jgi:hypothetical protein